jgi:type I restriction enzyme S subunit
MREDWISENLSNCLKLKSGDGLTAKNMVLGEYPVFGGNGIAGYHNEFNLSGEYLIIGRVGALCGNARYINEKIWLTDNAFRISEFKYDFNLEFLNYLLNHVDLRSYARQAAQPVISNSSLKDVVLTFPKSLSEQQQIVEILDQAFEAIDQAKANIEKNIDNAKELFQSKLNNIFSQKGEGWEEKSLGKACEISMGQSPKGTSYNSEGIGTPLINGPVEFGPKPFSKTVMTKWTTEPTKLCKEGDLILCVRGSTTGRINIAGFNACIGRGVASIRYSKNQEWINFFIRCNQKNIYDLGTGSTFPNVSGKIISSMKFSEPVSSEIQNNLVEVMKKLELDINSILKNYLKKLSDLEELKKSILQKAFAGELTNKVVEV